MEATARECTNLIRSMSTPIHHSFLFVMYRNCPKTLTSSSTVPLATTPPRARSATAGSWRRARSSQGANRCGRRWVRFKTAPLFSGISKQLGNDHVFRVLFRSYPTLKSRSGVRRTSTAASSASGSGASGSGSRCAWTTSSPPTTGSCSSRTRRTTQSSGGRCWRRPTRSELVKHDFVVISKCHDE